jgi:hypothetical protein
VNWDFRPLAMLGFTGVTPRDTRLAAVTVNLVDPDTPAKVAVIVVEPGLNVEAKPFDPDALLTDATPITEELHVTEFVRSCVE